MKKILYILKTIRSLFNNLSFTLRNFKNSNKIQLSNRFHERANSYSLEYEDDQLRTKADSKTPDNPLEIFFNQNLEGPGIWKWRHYFDIYHEHFKEFIGKDVRVVEVGVYSGGSLKMWQNYFGSRAKIYGIDIQPECKKYEKENITIFIGDQSDSKFWESFKSKVESINIFIDDGSHKPKDQIVTLEEVLPMLKPGGIYLCEDIQEQNSFFLDYVCTLQKSLSQATYIEGKEFSFSVNNLQKYIHSISVYPFVVVIKKNVQVQEEFYAPKHGTTWEPFL